jgi:hypothetical protein
LAGKAPGRIVKRTTTPTVRGFVSRSSSSAPRRSFALPSGRWTTCFARLRVIRRVFA